LKLKHFSHIDLLIFNKLGETIYTSKRTPPIHFVVTRMLISPDIWIHFRIRIGIPDHFGFVTKTIYMYVGIDGGAEVCVSHAHCSVTSVYCTLVVCIC